MEWIGFLFFFIISLGVALMLWTSSTLLGPKKKSEVKSTPFECGVDPQVLPRGKFGIKFYLIAMLFVVFDIELIYLFPWAVIYRQLGIFGFIEMVVFLGVVSIGLIYAWKKGALEWE